MQKHKLKIKNRKFLTFYFSVIILTFLFCVFNLGKVHAQQVTLSISPPLLETVIKPGKSIMIAYKIENLGDPVILRTKILPFEPQGELGGIKIKDEFEGPVRFSLDNANLQLDQPFFLKSRSSQQILLRIRIPEGAPQGDYYYTLLAETDPPPTTEGIMSSRTRTTIGTPILITVTDTGSVDINGRIGFFDVLPSYQLNFFGHRLRIFDSGDKIPVVAIVENTGGNLIKPRGEIVLRGNFGEKANYNILPQNILSRSQRLLTATPSATVDCQENNKSKYCQRPISLLISGFFIGLYTLSTTIHFGEGSPNIYASTSFIAFPIKLLIGLGIVVIITFIIVKRLREIEE